MTTCVPQAARMRRQRAPRLTCAAWAAAPSRTTQAKPHHALYCFDGRACEKFTPSTKVLELCDDRATPHADVSPVFVGVGVAVMCVCLVAGPAMYLWMLRRKPASTEEEHERLRASVDS